MSKKIVIGGEPKWPFETCVVVHVDGDGSLVLSQFDWGVGADSSDTVIIAAEYLLEFIDALKALAEGMRT